MILKHSTDFLSQAGDQILCGFRQAYPVFSLQDFIDCDDKPYES